MLYDNLTTNEKGHLCFVGRDTVELAEKYGTPVYIMDEERIRSHMLKYKNAMEKHFGGNSLPYYASKALCIGHILSMADECGIGVDVVSGGEIYTALRAGFPAERLCFHGSSKTIGEIDYAIKSGVGLFVCDNLTELERISACALRNGVRQRVLLRITPGIDPHTFAAVATGLIDSKFGLPIATGQAKKFTAAALKTEGIELLGFHCHIGSEIFDSVPLCDEARVMADFAADVRAELGFEARLIDLGGGFGVPYSESERAPDIDGMIAMIAECFHAEMRSRGFRRVDVIMEPGRSIVADAGITLYEIQDVKRIPGFKSYAAVDGGMADNPRYALYGAEHEVLSAERPTAPARERFTIAGRCCESGDMIRENVPLPCIEPGEHLAVLTTGAYNYSMASHYNCVPRPPIVMLSGGRDYIAVRRETYEDMTACQFTEGK